VASTLLKRPLHADGELFFTAPDRLEKRTLQPVAEDLVVEGDVLTISRGSHRSSLRLSQYPQLSPLLNGIRATLAGDRRALEGTFQVAVEQSGGEWSLTLRPLGSEVAPVYERIRIAGSAGVVHSVEMERHNGDRTLMTLSKPAEP